MKWQVIKIRVLQWLKKVVLYSLFGALVFFVVGFSVLQIPAVQKSLINRIMGGFSKVSGFDVQFDSFYLLWYDRLEITGLRVTDPEKNTMIEAGRLYINYSIKSVYQKKDIYLDALSLNGGVVNLVTIPAYDTTGARDLNINVFIAAINRQLSSGKKSSGGAGPKINIGEVVINQSIFSYNRTDKDSVKNVFDTNHFHVALDEGNLNNFKVIGDTIEFHLESMQAKDRQTQLTVKEMSTFFRISQSSMEFLGLNLNANRTHISDTIILKYNSQADLSDFYNKVTINANLKETKLYPQDLSLFTTGLEQWKDPILLNGHINGKVNHFNFSPMQISMGSTHINGSLEMDGLPIIKETFINAKLNPSIVVAHDLAIFVPDNVYKNLVPFNKIQLRGNFLGFINDFVANGNIITQFGQIESDINYKISEDKISETSYSGKLRLTNFDLGKFLEDTVKYQKVNMSGRINGKGFSKKDADFNLVGEISSIGLKGYRYSNIHSNARFANQFFKGDLDINDPNLQFNMTGSIDLRPGKDLINVKANLDTAFLDKLNLTKEKIFIQSYVDIDSRGLELDSIVGTALFKHTVVQYRDETIKFDSVRLISINEDNNRLLTLRSSLLDLSLKGDFYYSTLFNDIERLVHEFLLNLKNDPLAIQQYYQSKPRTEQTYKALITADVHNLNPVFKLLNLDLHTSKETHIQGEFSNSTTSIMHVFSSIDSLIYNGQAFIGNEIEFNGSKVRDSTQVLAQLTINSTRQELNKTVITKNLFLEGIWNKDHIDLGFDIDQEGYDNSIRLRSEIDFLKDSTKIKILPSVIKILGDNWKFNDRNYTLLNGQEWEIHHLGLTHDSQSIKIDGSISHDPTKTLEIDIKDFQMSFFNFFSTEKFTGLLNAQIKQRDLYSSAFIENELSIDSLTINKFFVGEIKGNNTRDPGSNHFNVDFTVDRLKNRIVDIKGYYDPTDKENPLHTKAILDKANLKLIEPVVKEIFSNLDGTLTGIYDIQGTFSKPNISGEAKIENGQIMINYLKTLYKVTGTLGITHDQIQFKDFELVDAFKNKGKLVGYIAHRSFSKMRINLDASFTNFQLLNTTSKDNNLFYGLAYGTGNLNILGPISNLKVSSTVRSNKNTRISIPVGGTASQDKKEFIQFTNFTDSVQKKITQKQSSKRELSGLALDLNVEVTPDAYTEIIFDIKSGDIIRGRGKGDILLQIDTKGDFNMFGVVEFTEGAYNFTLADIINKEFSIRPGSTISWFGDPYEANLNITASYRQLTSMGPVLSNQALINDPNLKRKYPVEVALKLEGPMLSPQINFDIEAKNLPSNVTASTGQSVNLLLDFNAFKAKLDEQELKRQVFSLIILRKLSPLDAFDTGGSLYNSVSELLSNQLSYWLSQVDQNLEIDLDLGKLDQETFNTFQLRLSYSFLNGRLRVTRDGNFGNSQATQSQVSTIAGDWTVDYLLTPDGKFKVKMYSRSNVNQLQSSLNTQTAAITTGASFIYTQNFNEFKDLLRSAREKRRKELEENPSMEDVDDTKGKN
jgi:TamB, inner membrane protein subunit of TAM complex